MCTVNGMTFRAPPCIYIYMELLVKPEILTSYIKGDSGGICNTLGNDSMCDSKQKSSYELGPILNLILH
jgi:hypothetical protein